jgi:hypothetical protein
MVLVNARYQDYVIATNKKHRAGLGVFVSIMMERLRSSCSHHLCECEAEDDPQPDSGQNTAIERVVVHEYFHRRCVYFLGNSTE